MKYSEIRCLATERLEKELFDDIGFKQRKLGIGGGFGFNNSIFKNRILRVGCGINIYGETSIVRHISGGINFLDIEEIYVPIVVKHGLMGERLNVDSTSTIGVSKIRGFENLNHARYTEDIRIEDGKGINLLVERFKEYYHEIAAPAFESFTSIEQFVPIIENMDIVELSYYFGMGAIFKKAIIYKLCNVKEYDKFINERLKAFEKVLSLGNYDVDTPKWYNTTVELKEVLDNTQPKYNI